MAVPATLKLKIDRSARAWQQVYWTLRAAIVSAQLEPGLSVSEISGIVEIWKVIESTKAHHDRIRQLSTHLNVYNDERVREHEAIIDALERRDAAEVQRLFELHLNPDRLVDLWASLSEKYGE